MDNYLDTIKGSGRKVLDFLKARPTILYSLAGYGAFTLARKLKYISKVLIKSLPFGGKDLKSRYGPNTWAVITGASKGIGEEFCLQLAAKGFNICLMARDEESMKKIAENIRKSYPSAQTRVISVDFLQSTRENFFDDLLSKISDLEISILVNNVGMTDLNYFEESSQRLIQNLLILNTFPVVFLTRCILPNMLKRKNFKSAIINTTSSTAIRPMPHVQIYSATKMFVHHFTSSLQIEFDRQATANKIDFLSFQPSTVYTQLANDISSQESWWGINPDEAVKGCLNHLGRYKLTHGNWRHTIFCESLVRWAPDSKVQKMLERRLEARKK